MVLFKNFQNIFRIPELVSKISFTLMTLIVYRLGTFIPTIGLNVQKLTEMMNQPSAFKGLLRYLDTYSGGSLRDCTIFALGVQPYITASIMMQFLCYTVPYFEQLMKEGDYGRKLINQYTRYLTVVLSIAYGFGYAIYLNKQNAVMPGLIVNPGWSFILLFTLSVSVGSLFVMWLGEQISIHGIGNGSSMIIFAGIVASLPNMIAQIVTLDTYKAVIISVILVLIASLIVFLEKGTRKIPVQYARRIVGSKVYGGQSSYIPFKINTVGVMPVILATSLINMPLFLFGLLADKFTVLKGFVTSLQGGGFVYNTLEFALIIYFTYFYTALTFNPTELADNLKKSGGFIPGIRPGRQTADYFDYILNRIGLVGAIYLGILAVAPSIASAILKTPSLLGGTSMLIMVGVALETASQIESYLIEHRYEGFLSTSRIKSK